MDHPAMDLRELMVIVLLILRVKLNRELQQDHGVADIIGRRTQRQMPQG